jgi:hypothetical protein
MSVVTLQQAINVLKRYIDERVNNVHDNLDKLFHRDDVHSIYENIDDLKLLADKIDVLQSIVDDKDTILDVGSDLENIDEVHDDLENIDKVHDNLESINTSSDNIEDINTVSDNIEYVKTTSDNIEDVKNFAKVYLGPKDEEPTERNDGSDLQQGDMYFNNNDDTMYYYDGDEWVSFLNADKLDDLDSSQFLRSDEDDTFDGELTITKKIILNGDTQFKLDFYNQESDKKSEIHFNSYTNSDSDYAYIRYDDDNDDYNIWGDTDENSALVLGVQNDGQSDTSDVIALESPAGIFFNAPNIYKGHKDNYSNVWSDDIIDTNKSNNGHLRLPNGLIIQWGVSDYVSLNQETKEIDVDFDITFPNNVFNVTLGSQTDNANVIATVKKDEIHNDKFTALVSSDDDSTTRVFYIAIGN